jgi:hypothetical protein
VNYAKKAITYLATNVWLVLLRTAQNALLTAALPVRTNTSLIINVVSPVPMDSISPVVFAKPAPTLNAKNVQQEMALAISAKQLTN